MKNVYFACALYLCSVVGATTKASYLDELIDEARNAPDNLAYRIFLGTEVSGSGPTGETLKDFPFRKCYLTFLASTPPRNHEAVLKVESLIFIKAKNGMISYPHRITVVGREVDSRSGLTGLKNGFRQSNGDIYGTRETRFDGDGFLVIVNSIVNFASAKKETAYVRFNQGKPYLFHLVENKFSAKCMGLIEDKQQAEEFRTRVQSNPKLTPFELMAPEELSRTWWNENVK